MLRTLTLSLMAIMIVSCGGESSTKVKSLQRKDKLLTCKEILLEMNEAEFYRSMAEKNKGPRLSNMLMPLGYISTYMNAEEAIGAAAARVDYLDRIYQIMECDAKSAPNRRMNNINSMPQNLSPDAGSSYNSPQLIDKSGLMNTVPGRDSYAPITGEVHYHKIPLENNILW